MQIILTAIGDALGDAWERCCGDIGIVTVHRGSILEVPCDAVVSPANSFGLMDGGVDAQYMEYFGTGIQGRVRQMIAERHHGELPVGAADVVSTGDDRIPYLIASPTMRVPMVITGTVNAYLAARAVFLLLRYGRFESSGEPISDRIQRVAFPGLGTGVGQLAPNTCALQMRRALDEVFEPGHTPNWRK